MPGGMSNYLENAVINAVLRNVTYTSPATVYVGLHNGPTGDTGANEIAGEAYIRMAATFDPPSGGVTQNTAAITFVDLPAATLYGLSIWDLSAGGNCLFTGWMGNHKWQAATSALDDTITCPAHGYIDTDRVVVTVENAEEGALPNPLDEDTVYFVVNAATDTFKLSLGSGGAAVNLTTLGNFSARKVTPKTLGIHDNIYLAIAAIVCALR